MCVFLNLGMKTENMIVFLFGGALPVSSSLPVARSGPGVSLELPSGAKGAVFCSLPGHICRKLGPRDPKTGCRLPREHPNLCTTHPNLSKDAPRSYYVVIGN